VIFPGTARAVSLQSLDHVSNLLANIYSGFIYATTARDMKQSWMRKVKKKRKRYLKKKSRKDDGDCSPT
jgi:hypothetical protein